MEQSVIHILEVNLAIDLDLIDVKYIECFAINFFLSFYKKLNKIRARC